MVRTNLLGHLLGRPTDDEAFGIGCSGLGDYVEVDVWDFL